MGSEAAPEAGSGTVPETGLERRLGVGIGGSAAGADLAAPGLRRSVSTQAGLSAASGAEVMDGAAEAICAGVCAVMVAGVATIALG